MSYFKGFPKTPYDFLRDGTIQNIVDLHRSVRPISNYLNEITEYTYYTIKDGERPDIVSLKLYDSPDYYWTFFIINDFLADGLIAWPMSNQQLTNYMTENFKGQAIITKPKVNTNLAGLVTDYQDNINANSPTDTQSFNVGDEVINEFGAEGMITQINVDMNQLIIEGDKFSAGDLITSTYTGKSVRAYQVFDHMLAPFYYYRDDDGQKRPATNPEFFGISDDGNNTLDNMPYVSNRAHIISQNDNRSRIRIISPAYIESFVIEYMRLINE